MIALTYIWGLALTCYRGEDFNWKVKSFLYQYDSMKKVIWGDNEFIATDGNLVYKSPNGQNWPENPTANKIDLWINGKYFALGYGISISPDSVTWITTLKTYPIELHDIVWGNSQYIVVGTTGTIMTSPDGINWTAVNSGITDDLYRITWGNGRYILMGDKNYYNSKVYTSTDGLSWSKINFPADITLKEQRFEDATWGKAGFVIAGDPLSYFSTDGVNWTTIEMTNAMISVTWCDGNLQYVGVRHGSILEETIIYTSDDGKTWSEHINAKFTNGSIYPTSMACHGDTYVVAGNCWAPDYTYGCLMYSP